jgi:hypothetical protein
MPLQGPPKFTQLWIFVFENMPSGNPGRTPSLRTTSNFPGKRRFIKTKIESVIAEFTHRAEQQVRKRHQQKQTWRTKISSDVATGAISAPTARFRLWSQSYDFTFSSVALG